MAAAIKAALGALLALAFVAWFVQIIGMAGLQRECYAMETLAQGGRSVGGTDVSSLASNLAITGIRGLNRSLACSDLYRYYWFMLAFQVVAIVGLAVMAGVGMLAASALSWMAWFTVLTLLHIQGSDTFLALDNVAFLGGDNYAWSRLTAAGWIMTTIANVGLIFLLGWRPRKLRNAAGAGPLKY